LIILLFCSMIALMISGVIAAIIPGVHAVCLIPVVRLDSAW